MTPLRAVVLAVVVALGAGCASAAATPAGPRTVDIHIHWSRYEPATVSVKAGESVRFVIHNDDPIDHEFIVGPDEVHRLHESGTHPQHGAVPGEISIPPHSVAETTYPFAVPGPMLFACHLPGHLAYGMSGVVHVTA